MIDQPKINADVFQEELERKLERLNRLLEETNIRLSEKTHQMLQVLAEFQRNIEILEEGEGLKNLGGSEGLKDLQRQLSASNQTIESLQKAIAETKERMWKTTAQILPPEDPTNN